MTEIHIEQLLKHYGELEETFFLLDETAKYADLVTASNNQGYPVQRWFHFKEAFSLNLLEALVADWKIESKFIKRIFDPFLGTGTSLLATQKLAKSLRRDDLEAVGMERNPFLHFVSQTKSQWHSYNHSSLAEKSNYILKEATKVVPEFFPVLSTLNREDVFESNMLKEILSYKGAIDSLSAREKALLLVGYADVLEDLSGTRKDGRALRIVRNKQHCFESVEEALQTAWCEMTEDLTDAKNFFSPISSKALLGDGRILAAEDENSNCLGDFDIIIYSPPYINNIDYTEVYKIELWMCGFISNREDFRSLRYKTFRSHPSVKFQNPVVMSTDERLRSVERTIKVLTDALPQDKDKQWRTDLFLGYFDDMYQSLIHQQKVINSNGWIFCVVGNSLHGSSKVPELRVPVAADLIIASIAKAIGLEVVAIQVARQLKRRSFDSHLLRESIIVMRNPEREVSNNGR